MFQFNDVTAGIPYHLIISPHRLTRAFTLQALIRSLEANFLLAVICRGKATLSVRRRHVIQALPWLSLQLVGTPYTA